MLRRHFFEPRLTHHLDLNPPGIRPAALIRSLKPGGRSRRIELSTPAPASTRWKALPAKEAARDSQGSRIRRVDRSGIFAFKNHPWNFQWPRADYCSLCREKKNQIHRWAFSGRVQRFTYFSFVPARSGVPIADLIRSRPQFRGRGLIGIKEIQRKSEEATV